ncbi:hypothetical protein OAQ72_00125 [Planktomarina temperata]|nr:hypothetical protein [Planktomarina temperata]
MALVIYRAIFGDYDNISLSLPKNLRSDIRCVLITDTPVASKDWEVIEMETQNPVLANRHCKMFPWEYFEADRSLYLDGHIEFGDDFTKFLDDLCQSNDDFSAMKHRDGGIIADELNRNIANSKLSRKQLKKIFLAGLDLTSTSVECGLLFRNHSAATVKEHAVRWWWYFNNVCPRDQLSVITAADEVKMKVSVLGETFANQNYFKLVGHKNARIKVLRKRLAKAMRVLGKGLILD